MFPGLHKRRKLGDEENINFSTTKVKDFCAKFENKVERTPSKVIDYSDEHAFPDLLEVLTDGKYGSVTKEYERLHAQLENWKVNLSKLRTLNKPPASPILQSSRAGLDTYNTPVGSSKGTHCPTTKDGTSSTSIVILLSDEEDGEPEAGSRHVSSADGEGQHNQLACLDPRSTIIDANTSLEMNWQPSVQYQKVILKSVVDKNPIEDPMEGSSQGSILFKQGLNCETILGEREREPRDRDMTIRKESNERTAPIRKESNERTATNSYVGSQDYSLSMESHHQDGTETSESDGLEDLWREMSKAIESTKNDTSDGPAVPEREEECEHSYILEDDMGIVCRVCGVILKSIETIFEYQWAKAPRSTRSYMSARNCKDLDEAVQFSEPKVFEDLVAADISIHPRHMKQMKSHQLEGLSFLVRNLVTDKPGGCILAHAPGSGKTFMLISFIQSFLAKYPSARPLVVLPKGILPTWKKEFQRWQVEEIPLYDVYSLKVNNRSEQLKVLKSWEENRGVLFMGYKLFANIVCGDATTNIAAACQERLLKVPSLLIIDEGHTPRTEDTDVLQSLAKVQTPRKVVLSGTLFQNHVKEVFNIFNLVRPNFLRMSSSKAVVKRILSKVPISGCKRHYKGDNAFFYDVVEEALQNDMDFRRKVTVIEDLREMTRSVLHYYKGDFLDELPGLVDFTVLLNLSDRQKKLIQELRNMEKFKRSSVGNAIYIHPLLREISENTTGERGSNLNEDKIDSVLDKILDKRLAFWEAVRDGVKTKFFLNILAMSESAEEKLLVFSQYLPPLKFLERLTIRIKGWHVGKEIFMISGESSSEQRESSMEKFNNSPDAKVFFGSIKACGEGISLVGASRVVILDVHLNPSVSRQAIGRAFRPGQEKKVYIYRLVAADSPEEEDHNTSFKKELISKMWFEWSNYCSQQEFQLDTVDLHSCQDLFLESPHMVEDIKVLYKR